MKHQQQLEMFSSLCKQMSTSLASFFSACRSSRRIFLLIVLCSLHLTFAFELAAVQADGAVTYYYVYQKTAAFGPPTPNSAPFLPFVIASPFNACEPITTNLQNTIAFVLRGECDFFTKVLNCQNAAAAGVVVANNVDSDPTYPTMSLNSGENGSLISISSVIIDNSDYLDLVNNYFPIGNSPSPSGYVALNVSLDSVGEITDTNNSPFFSTSGLVIGLVVTCSTLLLCIIIYRIIYARRFHQVQIAHDEPPGAYQPDGPPGAYQPDEPPRPPIRLNAVRYAKPSAGEKSSTCLNESCPICLEEFADGDSLNVLECRHGFHARCLEPWLNRPHHYDCPMCRSNVGENGH